MDIEWVVSMSTNISIEQLVNRLSDSIMDGFSTYINIPLEEFECHWIDGTDPERIETRF